MVHTTVGRAVVFFEVEHVRFNGGGRWIGFDTGRRRRRRRRRREGGVTNEITDTGRINRVAQLVHGFGSASTDVGWTDEVEFGDGWWGYFGKKHRLL
jgi:hypothetical protein